MKPKRCIGFLFFLVLVSQVIDAKNLDSLKIVLAKPNTSLQTKVDIFGTLLPQYTYIAPDSAKKYMAQLKKLAGKSNDPRAVYCYNYHMAMCFNIFGIGTDLDSIVFHLKNAVACAPKIKPDPIIKEVEVYYQLSYYYGIFSKTDSAIFYAKKGLAFAKKNNHTDGMALSAMSLGTIMYYGKNEYRQALRYYQFSDSLFSVSNKNYKDLGFIKTCMGQIFMNLKQLKDARRSYTEALKSYEQASNEFQIYYTNDRLAEIDNEEKNYAKAIATFKKGFAFYKKINDEMRMVENASFIADNYASLKQPDSTILYAQIAYKLSMKGVDTSRIIRALQMMSKGHLLKNDNPSALEFALRADKLCAADSLYDQFRLSVLEVLHAAQKNMGRNEEAYQSLLAYGNLKQKLETKRSADEINELEKKYQIEKKERQLVVSEQQKSFFKKQRWLFAAIIGLLFLIPIVYLNQRSKKRKKEYETKLTQLQMTALKSQMNPHFMFNSVNTIKGMIINNATEAAADQLTNFAKFMRNILNYSDGEKISLKNEIDFLKQYIGLENAKKDGYVNAHFYIDDAIDTEQIEVLPFIVQPFLENAFKHAFHNLDNNRMPELKISFKQNKETLQVTIEDNGIGLQGENENLHDSKGTVLVQKRLELHNLKKDNVSINFRGSQKGTLVNLYINV